MQDINVLPLPVKQIYEGAASDVKMRIDRTRDNRLASVLASIDSVGPELYIFKKIFSAELVPSDYAALFMSLMRVSITFSDAALSNTCPSRRHSLLTEAKKRYRGH